MCRSTATSFSNLITNCQIVPSYQYLECNDNHPHNNHHRHRNLVDYQDAVHWEDDGAADASASDYKDNSSHHHDAHMEHCDDCSYYNHDMEQ